MPLLRLRSPKVWVRCGVYAFAAVALFGLPGAIHGGVFDIVQWIAQTFLQLVLLSIILVRRSVQAAALDKRAFDTYIDTQTILHEVAGTLHPPFRLRRHLSTTSGHPGLPVRPAHQRKSLVHHGRTL
jgi:hypothetical protein